MKLFFAFLSLFLSMTAFSKGEEKLSARSTVMLELSQKSTGAFICAHFSRNDEKEMERLFNVGLEAGREFIKMTDKNPEDTPGSKLSMFWGDVRGGPTADFIMGALWTNVSRHVREKYNDLETNSSGHYASGNCRLLK